MGTDASVRLDVGQRLNPESVCQRAGEVHAADEPVLRVLRQGLGEDRSSADNSGRRSERAGGDAVRCWLMTTVGFEW